MCKFFFETFFSFIKCTHFFLQKLYILNNKIDSKTPAILPNKSLYWNDLFGIIKCKTSKILGYDQEKEKEYIQSVIKADFEEAGDEDVFRKLKADLKDHNIADEEIRKKMDELHEKAKSDFK